MHRAPPPASEAVRDFKHELEFLQKRVRALARGRFADELEDVASDAWIRVDRAVRKEGARNEDALMTRIAWRTWVDFCRRKASQARALGKSVPLDDVELGAVQQIPGIDPEALALWRFSICEWFECHQPKCLEPARQILSGRTWVQAAAELGERANSLAKRWQRCRELFIEVARGDRGELRRILDHFEQALA